MKSMFKKFLREEEGQDVIEWGLLVAFLSVILIATVTAIAPTVQGWYDDIETEINPAP